MWKWIRRAGTKENIENASLLASELWKIEKDASIINLGNLNDPLYRSLQRVSRISEAEEVGQYREKGAKIIDGLLRPDEKRKEIKGPIKEDTRIGVATWIKLDYLKDLMHSTREELERKILVCDDTAYNHLGNNHQPQTDMAFYDADTGGKHYNMIIELNNRLLREGWVQGIYGVGIAKHLEEMFNRFSLLPPLKGTDRIFTFYQRPQRPPSNP